MNIFLTSPCPRECAQNLDDKRLGTMLKESAQMLATGCLFKGIDVGYKATHDYHPCTRWARSNSLAFGWLVEHALWLADEHLFRFGTLPRPIAIVEEAARHRAVFKQPDEQLAFTFNSSGYATGDVFHDYKLCLVHKWKYLDVRKPAWRYRGRPEFYKPLYNSM